MSEPATETTEETGPDAPPIETEPDPATTEPTPEEEEAEEEEQTPAEAAKRDGSAKLEKAIERQITSNRKAFERIFGQDLESEVCAACGGAGYFGQKETTVDDLPMGKDVRPCADCDANGYVRTGSKNPNQATKACGTCNGNGWVLKPYEAPPLAAPSPVAAPAPDQAMVGQFIPGRGFQPFGSDQIIPLAAGSY